jgi:hypothetical protein
MLKSGSYMERVMGIEPTFSAWEADVLPLNYTRTQVSQSLKRYGEITPQKSYNITKLKPGVASFQAI